MSNWNKLEAEDVVRIVKEVTRSIGGECTDRDVIYGGEYVDHYGYSGYGLSLVDNFDSVGVYYNGTKVFEGHDRSRLGGSELDVSLFLEGEWQDVLYELGRKAPIIKANDDARKAEEEAYRAWVKQFNRDCCSYLPLKFSYHAPRNHSDGLYDDGVVRVVNHGGENDPNISIYRIKKKGRFGKKTEFELVFDRDGTFVDGDWLGYVQQLIKLGKAKEQAERIAKRAAELAAMPTAREYIDQLRSL